MDLNHYVEEQLLDFLDEFHSFLKEHLSSTFGADEWFERGVRPCMDANYLNRIEKMLTNPMRSVDMDKSPDELYGVEHIWNILNGNRNLLAPWFEWRMDTVRLNLSVITEMRHNIAHRRRNQLVPASSVRRCLDACTILLRAIESPKCAAFETAADLMSLGSLPWGPRLESDLPPRDTVVTKFVGREDRLTELKDWFKDPDNVVAVVGDGGAGKSAVAYEFATRIRDLSPEKYAVMGWVSAKNKQYVEGQADAATPDFTDKSSAIRALLHALYPWELEDDPTDEIAARRLRKNLSDLPGLVVVDDLDTIADDEELAHFLVQTLPTHPRRRSKILYTSRTRLIGFHSIVIEGFVGEELEEFLESRCGMFGLAAGAVLEKKEDIGEVTRGYPLYIEDLLRLATVEPLTQAIRHWGGKGGKAARFYALDRQLRRMSREAKETLIAISLAKSSPTLAELTEVIGTDGDDVHNALNQLQRAFLIRPPKTVDGEPRFDTNRNTKYLIRDTFRDEPIFAALKDALESLGADLKPWAVRTAIGSSISQAKIHVKNEKFVKAEEIIKSALPDHPKDADLRGALGWIYKAWKPPRTDDARQYFLEAYELGNSRVDTYRHWATMEGDHGLWRLSAQAAERGLERLKRQEELLYLAGNAHRKLAEESARGRINLRIAYAELQKARLFFNRALNSNRVSEKQIPRSDIFHGLALTLDDRFIVSEELGEKMTKERQRREFDELAECLRSWEEEDPGPIFTYERGRLCSRYPEVKARLVTASAA